MNGAHEFVWMRSHKGSPYPVKWPADMPFNEKTPVGYLERHKITFEQSKLSLNELSVMFPYKAPPEEEKFRVGELDAADHDKRN